MNKRLEMLEKMTASGQADAFAWYGLAMEYRKLGQTDDALTTFEKLREIDADYLPMYLMAGQLLTEANRPAEARPWLEQGIELARKKGDTKALGELGDALEQAKG
jgi:tetratricopeptide (TPR) repeat protein